MRVLSTLYILLLPFSAFMVPGPFGNFQKNAALPVFVILAAILLIHTLYSKHVELGSSHPARFFNRSLFLFFLWCAAITFVFGFVFDSRGYNAYGLDPLTHALSRLPVPLFIFLIYYISFYLSRRVLSAAQLESAVFASLLFVILYGYLQLVSLFIPNAAYETLSPLIESAYVRTDEPYVYFFKRINLTTLEPTEATRLLLIFYLPFIIGNHAGSLRPHIKMIALLAILPLVILSVSLGGFMVGAFLTAFVAWRSLSPRNIPTIAFYLLSFVFVVAIAYFLAPETTQQKLLFSVTDKLSMSTDSGSIQSRAAFFWASIQIIVDYPLTGIGWSQEIFLIDRYLPDWGWNWETTHAIEVGNGLAAKSLWARLATYAGVPAVLLLLMAFLRYLLLLRRAEKARSLSLQGTFIAVLAFLVYGIVDGGIVTSFFPWAALGIAVALADRAMSEVPVSQTPVDAPAIDPANRMPHGPTLAHPPDLTRP